MCTLLQTDIYTYLSGKWVRYQPMSMTGKQGTGAFYLNNRNTVHFEPVINIFALAKKRSTKRMAVVVDYDGKVVKRRSPRLLGGMDDMVKRGIEKEVDQERLLNAGRSVRDEEAIDWKLAECSHVYALCSIVCHLGHTPNQGHYTACRRNGSTGDWLYCSDTVVRQVTEQEALKEGAANGYVLFYAKVQH